jgi:hypothetical protein
MMMELVLAALLGLVGGAGVWWLARAGGPYRAGPWPGLTPRGALLLLAHALLLAAAFALVAPLPRSSSNLTVVALLAFGPLALATRLVQAPGTASAVCGAYLLPRSLASVLDPSLGLPSLIIVSSFAFDLATWLRANDLSGLANVWKRRRMVWQRRDRSPRRLRRWQFAVGGAAFGAVFVLVEANPSPFLLLAAAGCALIATGLATPRPALPTPPPTASVVGRETAAPRAPRPPRPDGPGTDTETGRT